MDEMITTYKVYVKTNTDGIITAINSSAFLSDTTGWTEIDEGSTDKYHHAQGHYLDNPIVDDFGLYNYKLVDNKLVERTAEDKQPDIDKINAKAEITQLKQKLIDTDYIGIKIGEGVATKEEYSDKLIERATWRFRINELEELIKGV